MRRGRAAYFKQFPLELGATDSRQGSSSVPEGPDEHDRAGSASSRMKSSLKVRARRQAV